MKDWVKILKAYHEGKFDRYFYGLTPRLIVGACQVPIGVPFENDIIAYNVTEKIFKEMRKYNKDGLIVSSNQCDIHKGPVMRFIEADWTESSIGTSFDKIWNRYSDEIIAGNFGISSYDRQILNTIF
ncbi:hypothetical protein GCM10011506_38570 [Marivirga lumbricoides]|uniref:Uncharacterized protein n=1 Tax=Marivirga lumbricoides TaxID=1046115 RepID=A0ABQ1N269_9BACT|nr:hypothetical protein GCM10011506_38570 [Marivirga lumbricoides]